MKGLSYCSGSLERNRFYGQSVEHRTRFFHSEFHHCYYPCVIILRGSYYTRIFDVPNEGHLLSNLDSPMHYTWPTSVSMYTNPSTYFYTRHPPIREVDSRDNHCSNLSSLLVFLSIVFPPNNC